MTAAKDLTGLVFGRLTVLRLDREAKRRSWACNCTCGRAKVIAQAELTRGDAKSCGCLRSDELRKKNKVGKVDHDTLCPKEKYVYRKWSQMWNRVRNPAGNSACYKGTKVCNEWSDFYVFLRDMGVAPSGFSLDRIDNSRGYEKENCRWIPLAHQAKNTRRSRVIQVAGKTAIVSDHARAWGLSPDVVFDRINKLGWDIDRALRTPKRPQIADVTAALNRKIDQ